MLRADGNVLMPDGVQATFASELGLVAAEDSESLGAAANTGALLVIASGDWIPPNVLRGDVTFAAGCSP